MKTTHRSTCPACGYALGGEVLGPKKEAELPDEDLPVYQGENKSTQPLKDAPASDDEDQKRAELAAALKRSRRRA
jgi:hypothetical protein